MNPSSMSDFLAHRTVRIAATVVVIALAAFLIAETLSSLSGIGRNGLPATDTITVTANGQATVAPDVAGISFSVENTAPTVSQAQEATTKQSNAVLDYVKAQGVAEKDVRTLSYNISPQYAYPSPCPAGALCPDYRAPKITGYQVSQTVQVTVRDLTKVGDLLSGLGKLEVQNVNGPSFALDDATAGHDAARADAIAKAKAQAELLSKQLGVHLGKIVNFSESGSGYPQPMMYGMGAGAVDKASVASPQIPAGENTYTASVSVTYEIR